MTPTTIAGEAAYLLDLEPDWSSPIRVDFELLAFTESGLTTRESRRALGQTLRVGIEFAITATGADATRLSAGLRTWTDEPVAVPFWPGATTWADRLSAPFGAKLRLAYSQGLESLALHEEGGEPGWVTDSDFFAPVLVGRLERRELAWITPHTCRLTVVFIEASPTDYALSVRSEEWTNGPAPSTAWNPAPPKILPFEPHYDRPTMTATVDVLRERIGFGRTQLETFYPQAPTRYGETSAIRSGTPEIATLIRFFYDHGDGKPFWVPSWNAGAILASEIPDGETAVSVLAGHDIQAGDWLAFRTPAAVVTGRAQAVASEEITLAATVGLVPRNAIVSHLVLCRFERARIRATWLGLEVADAKLAIREVASEYTPPTGETLGGTLGKLPTWVWLYEITEQTATGQTVHRFTSYECDVTAAGQTYTAARIDHGAIRQGIALERDEVDLKWGLEDGDSTHPLVKMATLRCESPLSLRILRAEITEDPTESPRRT